MSHRWRSCGSLVTECANPSDVLGEEMVSGGVAPGEELGRVEDSVGFVNPIGKFGGEGESGAGLDYEAGSEVQGVPPHLDRNHPPRQARPFIAWWLFTCR